MEKTLTLGAFEELSGNENHVLYGGTVIIPLGGVIYRCNIVYSNTAFKDACIWGVGSAGAAAVSGGGIIGLAAAGAIGFATSTASSINNGNAHFDCGFNF